MYQHGQIKAAGLAYLKELSHLGVRPRAVAWFIDCYFPPRQCKSTGDHVVLSAMLSMRVPSFPF